jgi:hypothetical protein
MRGQLEVGRLEEFPAWQDDVALELWVDAERSPARVRLAGTLDEATSPSLLAIVGELLDSGVRRIELVTDGLHTSEPGGSASLVAVEAMVERSGGVLRLLPPGTGRHGERPQLGSKSRR